MESPDLPVTETYPLGLHVVKALLLQRQYRQCIKACHEILQQHATDGRATPIQQTFAQFYLALAHDELARAMHSFSQSKIAAFDQAQCFYHEALTSLPKAEDCLPLPEEHSKPASRHDTPSEDTTSHSISTFSHARTQSDMASIPMSPPTHIRNNSLPMRSPPMNSPEPADSEMDELESHDSFGQIMTPTRFPKLERDYSSMSLIQAAQHHQQHHALMKPVRLGSPAKPYFSPPSRSRTLPARPGRHSMLPRIDTSPYASDAVRKQLRTHSEQASPVDFSPVSPLGSEGDTVTSDASTISPISPETPLGLPWGDTDSGSIQAVRLIERHLQAMRTQLQSHLKLLQEAKQRALDEQTERLTAKLNSSKASTFNRVREGSRLQQSMSYWSFTPEDQKVLEKQRRVQAGRDRGWMRARFDPTRYDMLADAALAEL
jgi:hypothetical protein